MPKRHEGSEKRNGIGLARGREVAGAKVIVSKLFSEFLHRNWVKNIQVYEDSLSYYSM